MQGQIDRVMPEGAWKFDGQVAACFDDMLERSIPGYHEMREAVYQVGRWFLPRGGVLADLGCSRGDGIDRFYREFGHSITYHLSDESEPMLAACRERWEQKLLGVCSIRRHDLRRGFPPSGSFKVHLALAVLTLQFLPPSLRQRTLAEIAGNVRDGGALIVVEKVLGGSHQANELLVDTHERHKLERGYTSGQIVTKRVSLEKAMFPLTARWNEETLRDAGFGTVERIWTNLNFAAWVAIKD